MGGGELEESILFDGILARGVNHLSVLHVDLAEFAFGAVVEFEKPGPLAVFLLLRLVEEVGDRRVSSLEFRFGDTDFAARENLGDAEGLADGVHGAGLEPLDDLFRTEMPGHEDHRNVRGQVVFLQLLQRLVAVQLWHHDIKQDQVERVLLDHFQRVHPVGRVMHLVTFQLERAHQGVYGFDFVVDDQNLVLGEHRGTCALSALIQNVRGLAGW